MDLGFDLDGRATSDAASATNAGVCARDPRARKSINGDGHGGVDNNFGSQVMPLLRSFVPDPEGQSEGAIRDGEWTVMLQIDDLGGDDDASAPGTLLLVANLGHPPTFTAEDRWPVVRVLGRFPDAFIAHGQWVSGFARSTFPLRIQRDAGLLRLYLDPGLVVVDLASGKTTVAGVLPLSAHVGSTETVVRAFGGCRSDRTELGQPSPVTDDTVKSVVEAADLVAGGADFQDPTVPCNAVSLGIGLTMTPTGEPSGTAPWPEVPDRCGTEGDVAGP